MLLMRLFEWPTPKENAVRRWQVTSTLMAGKRGLIMGLANDKSIAWGIAKALSGAGAELAFSYQGEALKKRVDPLAAQLGSDFVLECDVSEESSLDGLFDGIKQRWDSLDFVVHAIGFSDKSELRGRYVDTSPENFAMTMDISVYSFTAVVQRAEKLMTNGGSCLTLTYYGAEKVMPHYNVMGVAKAALEASVKYLAEYLGKDGIRVFAKSMQMAVDVLMILVQKVEPCGYAGVHGFQLGEVMVVFNRVVGVKLLNEEACVTR